MGQLTTARATEKEIDDVREIFQELASLDKYFHNEFIVEAIRENEDDFPQLFELADDSVADAEDFLTNLTRKMNNMRYEVVFFNLYTLMENVVDMESETLGFNEKFSKALELYKESNKKKQL